MDDGRLSGGDRSFRASVVRHLASGIALVALVATAFWGIGQMQAPEVGDPVIEDPGTAAETAPDDADPATAGDDTDAETPDDATPTEAATADDEAPPADTETAATGEADPADVSVQVLDAAGDGGARADAAEAALREHGHPIVARHQAVRTYEQSTLFYTPGHEEEARQIAARHPEFTVVEEKPDNLSDSVAVHVVVGLDYPGG